MAVIVPTTVRHLMRDAIGHVHTVATVLHQYVILTVALRDHDHTNMPLAQ